MKNFIGKLVKFTDDYRDGKEYKGKIISVNLKYGNAMVKCDDFGGPYRYCCPIDKCIFLGE